MSAIHPQETATLTPERNLAGLSDLGPGRSKFSGTVPNSEQAKRERRILCNLTMTTLVLIGASS
jgi:hypothetical protein